MVQMSDLLQTDPIALITYSTRPRGGVAHTIALGEAMHSLGQEVLIVGLGDPDVGFFREVAAPTHIVPAPAVTGGLEAKVDANIDALEVGLGVLAERYPVLHTQDCISARAAARVRDGGARVHVVRTVHHVDDFDTKKLMECQRQAILEPDLVFVVSRAWQENMADEYDVEAAMVSNGVDLARYRSAPDGLVAELRARVGAQERPLLLAVGGIEPRKGTDTLVDALGRLKKYDSSSPVLAVIGGHSFQDHAWYRDRVLASLEGLGLHLGQDIVELGQVPESEMAAWYAAADLLAFPSVKEGFGLAALEAMAAGTPVVTSDLPVFREWIDDEALLVPVGEPEALAEALRRGLHDSEVRAGLIERGHLLAERYSWERSARRHMDLYARLGEAAMTR